MIMSDLNENSQELIDIVTENKDTDDNNLLSLLIQVGVPFNKAKGYLNKIMVSQGLRMTKAQRDEKAEELMASFSITEDTTAEEVNDQIEMLADELKTTTNVARGYVRAGFAEAEVGMPKASTSSGPRAPRAPGFNGDVKLAADYAIANPVAGDNDLEGFQEYMKEHNAATTKNGADKSKRWYSTVVDLRIFANAWKDAGNCQ